MADLSITASTVSLVSGPTAQLELATTGTQGLAVTESSSTLVQASNTSAALADFAGVLLTAGSSGQPALYALPGAVVEFTSTPALVVGEIYVISVTGLLSPVGDYTTNDYLAIVGTCKATDQLTIEKITTGVQRA